MWSRKEIKSRGKAAFLRNYWECVVVAFILSLLVSGLSSRSVNGQDANVVIDNISSSFDLFITVATLGTIIGLCIGIFVFNVIEVGGKRFFLNNREGPALIDTLIYGFRSNYMNIVKTMFMRGLFTFLWTLLFIIPGVIKAYQYRLVPYLLAENPDLEWRQALDISKSIMNGHKADTFVYDLSFILWYLASAITFGLLGVFFVSPYVCASDAELYVTLKTIAQ
jgi:uncharacterized membrane protein